MRPLCSDVAILSCVLIGIHVQEFTVPVQYFLPPWHACIIIIIIVSHTHNSPRSLWVIISQWYHFYFKFCYNRLNMICHIQWMPLEMIQVPISWTIFHHNENSMKNFFQCNSIAGYHIATKFCTCCDSTAVMACAKFHNDHLTTIWMRAEWNFHQIWIPMENLFLKWAPEQQWQMAPVDHIMTNKAPPFRSVSKLETRVIRDLPF